MYGQMVIPQCRIRMRTIIKAIRPETPNLPDVDDEIPRNGLYILCNAGGRAQEALRSIIVAQSFLETTDIHVAHHLGCGMAGHSEEGLRGALLDRIAPRPPSDLVARGIVMHQLPQYHFLPIRSGNNVEDASEAVRDDVRLLRNHLLIRDDVQVKGWLYLGIGGPPSEHRLKNVDVPDAAL
ncbi:hypothetical protein OPQ81_004877 [Rhizoctonia solani]|nr:hypothetical protein OPQ81_004877 [Rhizoctonia solani]